MAVSIGLVGKPNVGKSTFFTAATSAQAEIGNYPFTTIEENRGVTFVRAPCPHVDLGVTCTPNNSDCVEGTRLVPIEVVDVAGLVPEAHKGKGLGNRFLDALRQADALLHVVDLSGATDAEGNPVPIGTSDPIGDLVFLDHELDHWIAGILAERWERTAREVQAAGGGKLAAGITERLTGLGVKEPHVTAALRESDLDPSRFMDWKEEHLVALAGALRRRAKPMLIVGNKADQAKPETRERVAAYCKEKGLPFVAASAEAELALTRASRAGILEYHAGEAEFELRDASGLDEKRRQALEYIRSHVLRPLGATGVARAVTTAARELLDLIVVYPVEDEHKFTDKQGRVLPDALLVPAGTTAKQMAYKVHTELGEHFIRAIDARRQRVIAADHVLEDGAVVRIVADK